MTPVKEEKKVQTFEMNNLEIKMAKNNKPFVVFSLTVEEGDEVHVRNCTMWDDTYQVLKDKMKNGNVYSTMSGTYSDMYKNYNVTNLGDVIKEGKEGLDEDNALKILSRIMEATQAANIDLGEFFMENAQNLITWPAAKSHHHAYKGGLMQHTKEVMTIAEMNADLLLMNEYDKTNLLAACALHDLFKVNEYNFEDGMISSNDEFYKQQISHTLAMYSSVISQNWKVAQLIGLHHGKVEWDALKEAKETDELLIHYADMLSSRGGLTTVKSLDYYDK